MRNEPKECFRQQMSGDSVMVWEAFSYDGLWDLQWILNSENYQANQHDDLISFGPLLSDAEWMFQYDNSSSHGSKYISEWFYKEKRWYFAIMQ